MSKHERIFRWMLNPVVLMLYILFIGASYIYFDKPIAGYFYQLHLRENLRWLSALSLLGKSSICLGLLLGMALYFQYAHPKSIWKERLWFLFLCVFISNFICLVLKVALGRARPDLFFDSQIYGFYWFEYTRAYWSFPSGHTTTIISLAAGLTVIFPRYLWLLFTLALLVTSTRILHYHHYLSDVLAAFYLTVLEVGLIKWVVTHNNLLTLQDNARRE